MRADWNRRARDDVHYYVAFGRHNQSEEEFYETAHEVVYGLEYELKRFGPGANRRSWRALEIGCGPGRLMKPLSRQFGEIHGVDVSDEMVRLARERLRDTPHAHVHCNSGADLRQFADESFDFVYSYAVFQHIPSRELVFGYLVEAHRVLKTGGLLWFQVNGLPEQEGEPDTWSGVRFRAEEIVEFANRHDFQMYTLEGVQTQYMWTSLRKRPRGWYRSLPQEPVSSRARIRRISNPHGPEPVVPNRGRFAVASLWIEDLHPELGLNHTRIRVGERWATPNYIAAPLADGQQQMNVPLPEGVPTGLVPVEIEWLGRSLGPPATMRVAPPGPAVPRLIAVTDATDILSGTRIVTGSVKVTLEEVADPALVRMELDGACVENTVCHCADPRRPRHEFVFGLNPAQPAGWRRLEIFVKNRRLASVMLETT